VEEPLLQNPVTVFLTIMTVILIAPLLMQRFRLPGIVGLIVGGIIIGPHALNLLSPEYTIETLAIAGLVYLMFSVGLEIDLRQFKRVRNQAIVFGAFTFAFPMVTGVLLGWWLGYSLSSSFLLGAVIASHALINYPLLSRLGVLRNDAVAASVGATVFTDVSALLVLAYVVRSGDGGSSALDIFLLVVIMIAYTTLILFVVPRLGKMFFRRFRGSAVEFQFILVVLFAAAVLAEVIDMHVIIGAFLAGLAVNSTLPSRSPVVDRILFLGEAFFIPIFVIYIGMIVDPVTVFTEPSTAMAGWMMVAAVYLSKLIPAWIVTGIFHYTRDELLTLWGISQAQATTTLAVLLVGVEMGMLPEAVFNGGVVMVMVTCITSSIIVQRFGMRLAPSTVPEEIESRYKRIMVAVSNPTTQENLLAMAGILARSAKGKLFPLHVTSRYEGECYYDPEEMEPPEDVVRIDGSDGDTRLLARVDISVAGGILNAAMENRATMIVLGWHGDRPVREGTLGDIIDQVLSTVEVPVMVGRIRTPVNAMKRLLLVVPPNSMVLGTLEEILGTVTVIASSLNLPIMVLCDDAYLEGIRERMGAMVSAPQHKVYKLGRNVVKDVAARSTAQDLIVVTTVVSRLRFGSSLGRIPEQLAAGTQASLAVIIHPA